MADQWQLALLKRSVQEWNAWRRAYPDVKVDLSGANISRIDFSSAYLSNFYPGMPGIIARAGLRGVNLQGVNLSEADFSEADLSEADLSEADVTGVKLTEGDRIDKFSYDIRAQTTRILGPVRGTDFRFADLRGANLRGANLRGASFEGANFGPTIEDIWRKTRQDPLIPRSTTPGLHPSQSSSTTDWLRLVQAVGSNLFVTAATLASIIQGLDVIERRWREHKEKYQQQSTSASQPSTRHASSSAPKNPLSDIDITDILLVMDDGSHHEFKQWVSDPDALRAYIDAFSDPTSKVKPLSVVFRKCKGRALSANITEGGKDNRQLNVILGYLDADPRP